MIYISDHGESLGEYGLYLHGTPFTLAPKVQKDVPFIVWASNTFKDKNEISLENLELQKSHSHKNIFHSVMGALGMRSDVYDKQLDIFSNN